MTIIEAAGGIVNLIESLDRDIKSLQGQLEREKQMYDRAQAAADAFRAVLEEARWHTSTRVREAIDKVLEDHKDYYNEQGE